MRNMSAEQLIFLLEKAEELGAPASSILRECHQSFNLDDLREGRIRQLTAFDFGRICQRCEVRIRERGWRGQGRLLSREDLDLMCHALVTSLTLREAIKRQERMFELLGRQHGWISLAEADGVASVQLGVGPGEMCWESFFTVTGCAGFVKLFEWLINVDLNAAIMVAEPRSEETRLLAGMFNMPFRFEESFNGFSFPADRLDLPVVRSGLAMREFLKIYPFNVFAELGPGTSLSAQVAGVYRGTMLEGRPVPDNSALARSFGMSVATLRRHLDMEGSAVRLIKDRVRHQIAIELLDSGRVPFDQIANQLGFSCASAFARAFLEWQGETPTVYRRRRRNADWSEGTSAPYSRSANENDGPSPVRFHLSGS